MGKHRKSVRESESKENAKKKVARLQKKNRDKVKRTRRTARDLNKGDCVRNAFVQMICRPMPKCRNIPAIILWAMWQYFVQACAKVDFDPNPEKKNVTADTKSYKIWMRLKTAFPEFTNLLRNRAPEVTKKRDKELDDYVVDLTEQEVSTIPGYKQDINVVLLDPREWSADSVPGYGYSIVFKMIFEDRPQVFEQFQDKCATIYDMFVATAPRATTKYYREKLAEQQPSLFAPPTSSTTTTAPPSMWHDE